MSGFFADLPNPVSTNFQTWASQLKTILCESDCFLKNLAFVPCGTDTADFSQYVGECEDLSSVMVIETCSMPRIWYHNGTVWGFVDSFSTMGDIRPVFIAYNNVDVFPLPYGVSQIIDWGNPDDFGGGMVSLDGGIITCERKGWYRFHGSCSIRVDADPTGLGNVPLSQHFHRLRWLRGDGTDHRAEFSDRIERFPTNNNLSFFFTTQSANFDIVLPRDQLGAGAGWFAQVPLRQSGLIYLDVGETVKLVMDSYATQTRPTIRWGVGGAAVDHYLYEALIVERLEAP